ncbi:hypothetical protein [Streptomyces sp. NPDC058632]|uniref:hypothetical protein n=1 Tax=Streptomyces sp. NPDC058632 TaxID=3346567 RepID=UPI003663C3FC
MAWKQWAASKRLKPGDGRELQRVRWWQLPPRSLFCYGFPVQAGTPACTPSTYGTGRGWTTARSGRTCSWTAGT